MREAWKNLASCITAVGSYPVSAVYRLEIPLRAFIVRSWCSANVYDERSEPYGFVAQNPLLVQRHISLNATTVKALHANGCTFIHDIDDLLWARPPDNPSAPLSAQSLTNMETSLRLADRVTTSTGPLAAALERSGIAAVVVPNLLDPIDWAVMPRRAERPRLRVGWYGRRDVHAADLDVIEHVVAALAGDVDFVFFGDLPRALLPRRAEFDLFPATSMELFPSTLAALDLDIVLSPLAKNEFNECKSNLPLLQAGMLGYSVIATDIEPHRTLPVTLVENTPGAWIRAIRDRVGELDAVRAEGQTLQAAVHAQYTLDDRRAEQIFRIWTGRAPVAVA